MSSFFRKDGGPKTPNGLFVTNLFLPLVLKLKYEVSGRKYKVRQFKTEIN
jgi:hypothetical protein